MNFFFWIPVVKAFLKIWYDTVYNPTGGGGRNEDTWSQQETWTASKNILLDILGKDHRSQRNLE